MAHDRVEVYEQCVELLLDRWEPVRTPDLTRQSLLARLNIADLKTEQLREELHKLALHAHRQPPGDDGRGLLDGAMLIGHLGRFFGRLRCDDPLGQAERFVAGLVQEAGLLQAPADDRYAFPHLTFQEYLAACGLADRTDMVSEAYGHWSGDDASRWREVLLLLMGRLRQRGSLSVEQYAVAWLDRLLAKKVGRQSKPAPQRWPDITLAALSYRELGGQTALASTQIDIEARVMDPLRTAIVEMLETPDSGVVITDRIEAARVLSDLGDPRIPITDDDWQATMASTPTSDPLSRYWCRVEAGTFWFGDDRKEELQQVSLRSAFLIARYLVTNGQYARFIAVGGYNPEQDWWTDEGRKFLAPGGHRWDNQEEWITLPRLWHNPRYNHPSQPVVGISWYEAVAYCRWLTAQGHTQGWLPQEEEIRLPTSLEWERAARGTDQRRYPWGDDKPTPEHANAEETGIGAPSPVGCFPQGQSPCGAMDMVGNVWEWTATHDEQEEDLQPREDFVPDDFVVQLRGGAFYNELERLCCGSRDRDDPVVWLGYGGLRPIRPLAHPNNSSVF